MKGDRHLFDRYDDELAQHGTGLQISYIVEWKDIVMPTLFVAGYVAGMAKEDEMTLIAIYLEPNREGYTSMYETLVGSKQLLDRSIKIDMIGNEIANRFTRLILE